MTKNYAHSALAARYAHVCYLLDIDNAFRIRDTETLAMEEESRQLKRAIRTVCRDWSYLNDTPPRWSFLDEQAAIVERDEGNYRA